MVFKGTALAKGKECLSCRDVLWCLVFCGFATNAMMEYGMSLTIIAMVIPRSKAAVISQCTHDVQPTSNLSNIWINGSSVANFEEPNITHNSVPSLDPTTRPEATTPINPVLYPHRFDWNEYEQGLALGGVYWFHWATQIPGGLLARRYGTKFVFGLANLSTALLGFLLPFCARYHLYALVALRLVQGICMGFIWPSMHDMVAKWIPPSERSTFISSYLGCSVGTALTYPFGAMLINWFGWDSAFYTISGLGVIWYVAWYYLAYDTPQEHPRISEAEKAYILENLGDSVNHVSSQPVPWKAILTSGPVWITAITVCGAGWGVCTISVEAPTYFSHIHGWDISATSVISAAPHLIRMLFSYLFSNFADWLLRTKRMSTTNLRKFAMFVCNGIQSILMVGLAFSGCHSYSAIVFMVIGIAASGAVTSGVLPGCIDLSPNFASIIYGISTVMGAISAFVIPLIVGILTNNNQTIEQWRLVFLITAGIIFATGALYVFFGTSDLQFWNDTGCEETCVELQKLNRSNVGGVGYDKTTDIITRQKNDCAFPVGSTGDHEVEITNHDR